jgi:hypothetical protein
MLAMAVRSGAVMQRYRGTLVYWIAKIWTISQVYSSTSRRGERKMTRKECELPDFAVATSHPLFIEIAKLDSQLNPWMAPTAKGKLRVMQNNPHGFTVKCVGVFDTVGSVTFDFRLEFPVMNSSQFLGLTGRVDHGITDDARCFRL